MPRRISDYPDAFAGWNLISSFGSILSVAATWLFLYLVYVQLIEGKATNRYPWLTAQFYSDILQALLNRSYNSLEWALISPPAPHAFTSLPRQSGCPHGKAVDLFCQLCWNAANSNIINCTHIWKPFTQASLVGTKCDFGGATHEVTNAALSYTCEICHAICCTGCIG